MLTYESRGQGVDTTLLTLNRGEGGQNVMTSDYWDQLGTLRTQELLAAGNYYGVHQYWTRVADFGFSKTIEEAPQDLGRRARALRRGSRHSHPAASCSHQRFLRAMCPTVTVIIRWPAIWLSGFTAMAGDPKVFPDQIKAGLLPWSPLKVYARVPFARVTEKGIYDYATGHYAPARFPQLRRQHLDRGRSFDNSDDSERQLQSHARHLVHAALA